MTDQFEEMLDLLREPLADKYEMESLLGSGGMGAVYLARDIKHDRPVAIKVLHPEFAQSLGSERFLREVAVTAKLSHPHVLPLYDSGNADGFLYYVMPLIEGEDLGERIAREKQLPIKDTVHIAKEVAEAIGYAHSMGLVHRDIKPGNIMLSGGHAIVVDFGIARAVDAAADGSKITQTGMSVGTPAYMAPEQGMADEVDGRADLYSLGCVIYEMLVGQVPFTAPTPSGVIARHAMDSVPPVTIMREAIPDELEDVIMQAMAKTPADRYQTGMEMAEALDMVDVQTAMHRRSSIGMRQSGMTRQSIAGRQSAMFDVEQPWWKRMMAPALGVLGVIGIAAGAWAVFGGGGERRSLVNGGPDPRSVAVLYFVDLSSSGEWAHVADGLTEGLIANLSQVRELSVVSRNGVAQFRGSDMRRDSIATALNVGSIVEGSVEEVSGGLKVETRLLDASGSTIDRANFVIAPEELLTAQDSVVQTVANLLRQVLGDEVQLRQRRETASNVDAWLLLQRAERFTKDGEALLDQDQVSQGIALLLRADSALANAEAADPEWIEPIISRGWIARQLAELQEDPFEAQPWIERGLGHAERALVLGGNVPRGLELRGTLRLDLWYREVTPDPSEREQIHKGATEDLEAAVAAEPSLTRAWMALNNVYYDKEDATAAMMAARRAYEEDAYLRNADGILIDLFWGSMDLEQFGQSRRWCAEGVRRFPRVFDIVECQLWQMATPALPADPEQAWQLYATLDTLAPEASRPYLMTKWQIVVGGVLARAGLTDSARSVLERARASITHESDPTQDLASVEAYMRGLLGDYDEAIDLLKLYVASNPGHAFAEAAGTLWWWRDLRAQPRFREVTGSDR